MRDRHPSISFVQYKLTHFHDPSAQSSTPAPFRLYRCRLCRTMVKHSDLVRHQFQLHRNPIQHPNNRVASQSMQQRQFAPPSRRRPCDTTREVGGADQEEDVAPKPKRPRPASMFYHEQYNPNDFEPALNEEEDDDNDGDPCLDATPSGGSNNGDSGREDGSVSGGDNNNDMYELQCTDDVHDMCLSRCNVCAKILALDRIFVHLNQAHAAFQFRSDVMYHIVRKTYYRWVITALCMVEAADLHHIFTY